MKFKNVLVGSVLSLSVPAVYSFDAAAQSVIEIEESLSDSVPTSGGVLVGLSLVGAGPSSAPFDLDRLELAMLPNRNSMCIKIISRDGRYTADGAYRLTGTTYLPVTASTGWQYRKELSVYNYNDIAPISYSSQRCAKAAAREFRPAKLSANPSRLIAHINSQRSTSLQARLMKGDEVASVGECSKPGSGASRAFDSICYFSGIAELKGLYDLKVRRLPRSGPPRVETFKVSFN